MQACFLVVAQLRSVIVGVASRPGTFEHTDAVADVDDDTPPVELRFDRVLRRDRGDGRRGDHPVVTSTCERSGSSPIVIVADTSGKRPLTLVIMRCRATIRRRVWGAIACRDGGSTTPRAPRARDRSDAPVEHAGSRAGPRRSMSPCRRRLVSHQGLARAPTTGVACDGASRRRSRRRRVAGQNTSDGPRRHRVERRHHPHQSHHGDRHVEAPSQTNGKGHACRQQLLRVGHEPPVRRRAAARDVEPVHLFEVGCEPLEQCAVWLMVDCVAPDSRGRISIAGILPDRAARRAVRPGSGCCCTPVLGDRLSFEADDLTRFDRVLFKVARSRAGSTSKRSRSRPTAPRSVGNGVRDRPAIPRRTSEPVR
jgi:hypothetical protein